MEISILVFGLLFTISCTAAAQAEGWIRYRDELVIKVFPGELKTYDDAKAFCSAVGIAGSDEMMTTESTTGMTMTSDSTTGMAADSTTVMSSDATTIMTTESSLTMTNEGSLVMVKDSDLEPLLKRLTEDISDNIWLGGKYATGSQDFLWDDGSPLTYTNWLTGYPRVPPPYGDACIEFRPTGLWRSRSDSVFPTVEGTWSHSRCRRKNVVMCQMRAPWTHEDIVNEMINLRRKQQEDVLKLEERLAASAAKIKDVTTQLDIYNANAVPLGFIYVEYYGQPSPGILWPSLTWEDVTSNYAGLFFRALGGDASEWGLTQEECAPRITGASYRYSSDGLHSISQVIPSAGWSDYLQAGEIWKYKGPSAKYDAGVRFFTDSCEVRPTNQAIRIWKRTELKKANSNVNRPRQ